MSCCDEEQCGCELHAAIRNRYYYGKQMGVDQFQRDQTYHRDQRRLVNRLALGSGILCGLGVSVDDGGGIIVDPGVAIDGWGRVVIVAEPQVLTVDDEFTAVKVRLCYRECCILPAPAPCSDPCHPSTTKQYDAIEESFELSVQRASVKDLLTAPAQPTATPKPLTDLTKPTKPTKPTRPPAASPSAAPSCDAPDDPCIVIAKVGRDDSTDSYDIVTGQAVGHAKLAHRVAHLESLVERLAAQLGSAPS